MSAINMGDVVMLYELGGVYDGWSVAELRDGTFVNRWSEEDYPGRWKATEEYIEKLNERNAA